MKYESVFEDENLAHLNRHLRPQPLDIGSQFTLNEEEATDLLQEADEILRNHLESCLAEGKEPGRFEVKIVRQSPVGTDSLVDLSNYAGGTLSLTRDEGTKNQQTVNVLVARHIPTTNVVTVIAGPYGPTGVWGIYTMFPGEDSGSPFPNKNQPEDVQAKYKAYWDNHGFLISPETARAHLDVIEKKISEIGDDSPELAPLNQKMRALQNFIERETAQEYPAPPTRDFKTLEI